jgi:uncharacterized membrane protein YdbT with pleckstrin-like domain
LDYIEQNLIPGETVLYRTRLHWIVLFWPVVVGAFFGVPGLLILVNSVVSLGDKNARSGEMLVFGIVLLAIAAVIVQLGIWSRKATEMAVTSKRVIIKVGLLSKKSIELLLSKIESIGVEQGLPGRMFGYGSVVIRGTGGTAEAFTRVASPLEFRRQVHQQIERASEARTSSMATV